MQLGLEAGANTHDLAVELGVKGVPISAGQLVEQGVDATLAPLSEKGLAPCQIDCIGYNALAPDADEKAGQAALLDKTIPLAKQAGCRYIAIGPASYQANPFVMLDPRNHTDQAIEDLAEALKPHAELAEKHDAIITIEAYLKGVVNSAQVFSKLQAKVGSDHLCCNVDPSSLYAGIPDYLDPMPLVERTISGLAGHVGLVHLKEFGVEYDVHIKMGLTPIGKGNTDWGALLKQVEPHVQDDAWVIIEHCLSPEEAKASVQFIRDEAARVGVTLS